MMIRVRGRGGRRGEWGEIERRIFFFIFVSFFAVIHFPFFRHFGD